MSLMYVNLVLGFDNYNRGWQQSTINSSALMKWQNDLHLDTGDDMLLIGFINAAPWLSGSLMYVVSQLEPN